jgi:hypothetical protein
VIFGHLGLAAAVRGRWPSASLLWLLPASVAPDVLDVAMAVTGICNPDGLYSHTIPVVALLAALVGGAAYLMPRGREAGSTALATAGGCAAVIVLHPVLDLLTGHKLFWPGGPLVGLRLYEHPFVDFLLESALVILGWLLLRRSRAVPRWATAPATVYAVLALQGVGNLSRGSLKPNACPVVAAPPL